jgi:hypothetical protein
MGKIGKASAVLLTLIIAISCLAVLMVKPSDAQSIPKPSAPEFTVNYINSSYYIPPSPILDNKGSVITDDTTGQPLMTGDYYVNNSTIQIIIKNQPYGTYTDNGYPVKLYYNVRFNVLTASTYIENGVNYTKAGGWSIPIYDTSNLPVASNEQYTVIEIHHQEGGWNASGNTHLGLPWNGYLLGLQVEAMLGSIQKDTVYPPSMNFTYFYGQTSDWSDTQTLTIPDTNLVSSWQLALTPTPITPESDPYWMLKLMYYLIPVGAVVAVVIISCFLLIERHRKRRNQTT